MISRHARTAGDAVFDQFRPRPGSDFIASGFALAAIAALVERRTPTSILEIGSGIGTITVAILDAQDRVGASDGSYVGVEDVPFCLEQLDANLGARRDRVTFVPTAAAAPPGAGPFDLVVVDGGAQSDLMAEERHRFTVEAEIDGVRAWLPHIAPGAVVVFENVRARQRRVLEEEVGRPFVHEHLRPLDGSPGMHLYWFEPPVATRALAPVREGARALWFGRGLPLARLAYGRFLKRPFPRRNTVAPGEGGWD